jgi:hypothetical protein
MMNTTYVKQASATGAAFRDEEKNGRDSIRWPGIEGGGEAAPGLLAGPALQGWGWLTPGFNVVLHIFAMIVTCIVCIGAYGFVKKADGARMSGADDHFDAISFFVHLAPIVSITAVALTVFYWGVAEKDTDAGGRPILAILSTGAFLWVLISLIIVQAWVLSGETNAAKRELNNDGWLAVAILANAMVVSSTLQTPLSGTIYASPKKK